MCEYCKTYEDHKVIEGEPITEFKETIKFKECNDNSKLEIVILKARNDKKAGLMVNTGTGYRYIDINYCPFCGRKISE